MDALQVSVVAESLEAVREQKRTEELREDSLREPFEVYIQILVSQALDSKFLAEITQSQSKWPRIDDVQIIYSVVRNANYRLSVRKSTPLNAKEDLSSP